ncbi:LEAF RUST 10 DISEASE-RESISTANCE LOCUS RECEPTOR-LIKE PROTEIN KINASE-like 2.1 isoform X4 [Carya illinoinensis]|uniref:LEAF RUST 10 DISEASE-RESISTANCE LOCUS RECEPTOR-LIKE PROTEIN KINASE-like 2.1 isoform X4 n=1 Tax=Carya illinoinensis TaxID=32201 RepID=UPI001C727FDE|nr:LEAF RUST 10 DISEASE-RESISTANCE LOCUS RECEPTOR-LIKE PROTEIN KINASE-like 2.1 isoform X4 [Carya illinoinensis]
MAIRFSCPINGSTGAIIYYLSSIPDLVGACKYNVKVPVVASAAAAAINLTEEALIEAIDGGFMLEWNASNGICDGCQRSGGLCGFNTSTNAFACHCASGTLPFTCGSTSTAPEPSRKLNRRLVVVIGIPTGTVVGIVVLSLVIICNVKRGHLSSKSTAWWKRYANNYHFNAHEKIIANFGSMAPKRYTYSDLKKLTKSFKDKVGEGGFGVVYKGKLPDGRIVAVKVLSKSKDNGEEFINEVASISRTSHVNIVSLLGFCCERSRRALIYEFVTNGSLDGFIYDKGTLDIANCHLENKTMFQIAIGIARGLEYLHSGCRTRILHLDIKPHNILLDKNFCPKISDFGLAKMCKTRDQSVVSMMGTRGTIGYIAPEVFSRTFGGVSHKSDVYSYGMLVLEMVGGRKDIEGGISGTSEKYFPHGIYKKLEQDEILGNSEVTRDEEDIVKKMIIVSLWCIQTNPLDRPSIGKVIEMLEGSTPQSLQFPPKPFLNSPPRPPIDSSTTSLSM